MLFSTEIAIVNGQPVKACFDRASIDEALSAWHLFMASCMANPDCSAAICIIADISGTIYKKDPWTRAEA